MGRRSKKAFLQRRHTDVQKHMKRCSTMLIIRKMQIKITMRYYFTLVRMTIITKTKNKATVQILSPKYSSGRCNGYIKHYIIFAFSVLRVSVSIIVYCLNHNSKMKQKSYNLWIYYAQCTLHTLLPTSIMILEDRWCSYAKMVLIALVLFSDSVYKEEFLWFDWFGLRNAALAMVRGHLSNARPRLGQQ